MKPKASSPKARGARGARGFLSGALTTVVSAAPISGCASPSLFTAPWPWSAPNLSADLHVASMSVSPNPATAGLAVAVSATVSYCCDPEGPLELDLLVDGARLERKSIAVAGRGERPFDFVFVPTKAGTSLVSLVVDPQNLVKERFDYMNVATLSLQVSAATRTSTWPSTSAAPLPAFLSWKPGPS